MTVRELIDALESGIDFDQEVRIRIRLADGDTYTLPITDALSSMDTGRDQFEIVTLDVTR